MISTPSLHGAPTEASLVGRTAIVTGGTTGIGRATARLLAARGVRVLIIGKKEYMDDALAELGAHGEVHGLVADVSNQKEIAAAFTTADEIFGGKLDILINNAAVPASSILKTDPADYAHLLGVNLLGYLYCSRYAFDRMHLVKSGHMVNIGSLCADIRDKGADIYVAAKSGVDGFTDSFRKAVASHGIRVTQIHPGVVGTNLITESLEVQQERQHLNEMLKAEDVAEAVLYAVSLPDRVDITEIIIRPHGQSEL